MLLHNPSPLCSRHWGCSRRTVPVPKSLCIKALIKRFVKKKPTYSPVHTDHAQRHDGCSTAHHIHADEDVTEDLSKKPLSSREVRHDHEWHDHNSHGEIRHGQRHQQIVGRLSELLNDAHRDHHQHISNHRHGGDDGQHHSDDNLLRCGEIEQRFPAGFVPHGQ